MSLVLVVVAIAVLGVVAMVALGRIRGGLDDAPPARPDHELPPGRLSVADLAGVRFSVALRGYRMDEVDVFVDRLRDELAAAQTELATVMVERAQLEKSSRGRSGHTPEPDDVHDRTPTARGEQW